VSSKVGEGPLYSIKGKYSTLKINEVPVSSSQGPGSYTQPNTITLRSIALELHLAALTTAKTVQDLEPMTLIRGAEDLSGHLEVSHRQGCKKVQLQGQGAIKSQIKETPRPSL
jgi:hypothetical protein